MKTLLGQFHQNNTGRVLHPAMIVVYCFYLKSETTQETITI